MNVVKLLCLNRLAITSVGDAIGNWDNRKGNIFCDNVVGNCKIIAISNIALVFISFIISYSFCVILGGVTACLTSWAIVPIIAFNSIAIFINLLFRNSNACGFRDTYTFLRTIKLIKRVVRKTFPYALSYTERYHLSKYEPSLTAYLEREIKRLLADQLSAAISSSEKEKESLQVRRSVLAKQFNAVMTVFGLKKETFAKTIERLQAELNPGPESTPVKFH